MIPDSGFESSLPAGVKGSVGAAEGRDVLLWGHLVQLDRVGIAEDQVEHPPVVEVEPVGQNQRRQQVAMALI